MADGDVDGAVAWLGRSIAAAPSNFCAELGQYLAGHPDMRLREVAGRALERAKSAPPRPVSQIPDVPAAIVPKPPLTPLARGQRSMRRVLRALTRAASGSGA